MKRYVAEIVHFELLYGLLRLVFRRVEKVVILLYDLDIGRDKVLVWTVVKVRGFKHLRLCEAAFSLFVNYL